MEQLPSGPRAPAVAAAVTATLLLFLGTATFAVAGVYRYTDPFESVALASVALSFAVVGLVVVVRRPDHRLGRVFLAGGLLLLTSTAAAGVAQLADSRGWSWAASAVLLSDLAGWSGTAVAYGLGLLLFPTGRLLGPRWRVAVAVLLGGTLLGCVAVLANPLVTLGDALSECPECPRLANPIGLELPDPVGKAFDIALLGIPAGVVAGLVALVLRYRRGERIERLQIQWVLWAAVLLVVLFFAGNIAEQLGMQFGNDARLFALGMAGIPVAAGMAVLRYRLFEIDRIVGRTVTYGVTMGLLIATYAGGVLGLRALLGPVASTSEFAVAVSTLAVTALFGPVRRRVQAGVDRRFFRTRVDAAAAVATFASRLRDEVSLEAVRQDLVELVGSTLSPSSVLVWVPGRYGYGRDGSPSAMSPSR